MYFGNRTLWYIFLEKSLRNENLITTKIQMPKLTRFLKPGRYKIRNLECLEYKPDRFGLMILEVIKSENVRKLWKSLIFN